MAQNVQDDPQIALEQPKPDFRSGVTEDYVGPYTPPDFSSSAYASEQGGQGGGGGLPYIDWVWRGLKKLFAPGSSTPGVAPTANQSNADLLKKILKDPKVWKGAAGTLGSIAGGSATERGLENTYGTDYNRSVVGRYGVNQDAVLSAILQGGRDTMTGYNTRQQALSNAKANESIEKVALAKLGLDVPTQLAQDSVRGSIMQNLQPLSFTSPAGQQGHLTSLKGGLSAATLDPMTRAHGTELMKQAMEKQLSPDKGVPGATDFLSGVLDTPPPTDYSKGVLKPPDLQQYQDPGKLESITSGVGTGVDWLSKFLEDIERNKQRRDAPRTDGTV